MIVICPNCEKGLVASGTYFRFCHFCGIEIPLPLILEAREKFSEKLNARGSNFQEPIEKPCDEDAHSRTSRLLALTGKDPSARFCSQCGNKTDAQSLFCSKCGNKL